MSLEIFILQRANIDPVVSEVGTDTDTVVVTNHGMTTGEMILNSTRNTLGNPASRAITVVDANTLQLNHSIVGQTSGDLFFLFKYAQITNIDDNTFRISRQIEKNRSCSFSLLVDSANDIPESGQQILVKYNNKIIFGGAISDIRKRVVGIANNGHKIRATISSNGYNHIPARRSITVDYTIPMTSGQIVTDMIDKYLSAEGITAGTIQTGASWDEYPSDFPDKCISVKTVLDDMANKSGYKWYIDIERKLHFLESDTVVDAVHKITDDTNVTKVWENRTAAANSNWISVCYGNGMYVALSAENSGNSIMTSPDGINWTLRTTPIVSSGEWESTCDWISICYGEGLFVAIRNTTYHTNQIMTSPDGINWTLIATNLGINFLADICYGNGLFVATSDVFSSAKAINSPDGINWTVVSVPKDYDWVSICYGNGMYVAVAKTNGSGPVLDCIMTSTDGINWTNRSIPYASWWNTVCYGNGLFVALAWDSASNNIMTSPDGVNWAVATVRRSGWYSISYGNGLFVAVAGYGSYKSIVSTDGVHWEDSNPGSYSKDICYGKDGVFVTVSTSKTFKYSQPFRDFWDVEISQSLEDYRNKQFVKGGWDYYYGDAMVNYMENEDGIISRQMTEGGSGVYGAIYEDNSEDTNVREMTAEAGTTTTNINIANHGLKYGDMVMNLTNRKKRSVAAVIDANNFLIDSEITLQAPGDIIATYPDANTICRNNLNKYGLIVPKEISFETTALDFEPGTKLTVNLQAFGMTANEYYLIESVELWDEDGINLLATVTATQRDETEFNTQQSESWVDTFAKLGGGNSGSQIVEMTSDQAGGLAYFAPGKYIVKRDEVLPVIAELDGAATLADVIAKVNTLLQTLVSRQHLSDGTPVTGLKRVDLYKYS